MQLKFASALLAASTLFVASNASAIIIDEFTTVPSYTISQTGVGTTLDTRATTVIGGLRHISAQVSATITPGSGTNNVSINNLDAGALGLSSQAGVDALDTLAYGSLIPTVGTPLNANFSTEFAFVIRVNFADQITTTNVLTVVGSSGSASSFFTIPVYNAASGFIDVVVPFAAFPGFNFADVDGLSFAINGPRGGDYAIESFITVPEASSAALLTPALLLAARRRRA